MGLFNKRNKNKYAYEWEKKYDQGLLDEEGVMDTLMPIIYESAVVISHHCQDNYFKSIYKQKEFKVVELMDYKYIIKYPETKHMYMVTGNIYPNPKSALGWDKLDISEPDAIMYRDHREPGAQITPLENVIRCINSRLMLSDTCTKAGQTPLGTHETRGSLSGLGIANTDYYTDKFLIGWNSRKGNSYTKKDIIKNKELMVEFFDDLKKDILKRYDRFIISEKEKFNRGELTILDDKCLNTFSPEMWDRYQYRGFYDPIIGEYELPDGTIKKERWSEREWRQLNLEETGYLKQPGIYAPYDYHHSTDIKQPLKEDLIHDVLPKYYFSQAIREFVSAVIKYYKSGEVNIDILDSSDDAIDFHYNTYVDRLYSIRPALTEEQIKEMIEVRNNAEIELYGHIDYDSHYQFVNYNIDTP